VGDGVLTQGAVHVCRTLANQPFGLLLWYVFIVPVLVIFRAIKAAFASSS
jgi:hypothetical protein